MKDKMLTIILLSYYSGIRLKDTTSKIIDKMEDESIPFEIVIMDDGSEDDSFEVASAIAREDSRIRAFQLSRNFTTNYSKFAGLSVSKGSCVTFLPDDLQRPLETIVQMYRLWEQGHKLIFDYRTSRNDGKLSDLCSRLYYKVMNSFSELTYPPGGTDGFLADREIVDLLNNRIRPTNTSIVIEALKIGFDPVFIPAPRPKTEGKSRWTLKKKIRMAKDIFFTSSDFPIKILTYVGVSIFLVSIAMIPFVIYLRFFSDNMMFGFRIPGWTTIILVVITFSALNMFFLGIVAEYIWRIYSEVKDRPGFIIKKNDDPEVGKY